MLASCSQVVSSRCAVSIVYCVLLLSLSACLFTVHFALPFDKPPRPPPPTSYCSSTRCCKTREKTYVNLLELLLIDKGSYVQLRVSPSVNWVNRNEFILRHYSGAAHTLLAPNTIESPLCVSCFAPVASFLPMMAKNVKNSTTWAYIYALAVVPLLITIHLRTSTVKNRKHGRTKMKNWASFENEQRLYAR